MCCSLGKRLAERTRVAIGSRPFAAGSGGVHITASFGVAASSIARPFNSKEVLQLADEALYRAKLKGRNRSEGAVSQEPVHSSPEGAVDIPVKSEMAKT